MTSLANKVFIITGGTKGIGNSIAKLAVKAGARVAITYSSDSSAAERCISELGSDNALAIKADAGSIAGVEETVKATIDRFGTIDVLIPNAGYMPMVTSETSTEEHFDDVFNLNVKGPWFLVQKAVPHMKPGSRIIFVSTTIIHSSTLPPTYGLYGASKGAIEHMTHAFSKELAAKGINVNAVAPGPTGTELFFRGKSEQMIKTVEGFSPYKRLGKPDEIGEVFTFLSSDAGSWISGQVIPVNGAMAWL